MLRAVQWSSVLLLTLGLVACPGEQQSSTEDSTSSSGSTGDTSDTEMTTEDPEPEPPDYSQLGPHPVGHTQFVLDDSARDRQLRVEVWYPADESASDDAAAGRPIEAFVPVGDDHDQFVDLLATAHDPGTRRQTSAATDATAAPAQVPWPTILFSHCHACTRFSSYSVAEYLASHGFAVVSPDHQGNTLFDELAGMNAPLNGEFLITRREDLGAVLDAVLDPAHTAVPEVVRGMFDATRVGAIGHSYGAATVGLLAQEDARVQAILPVAAPIENPLLPGPTMMAIEVPVFFVLAREDNSITELGNNILRNNFMMANPPVWMVEVNDAGHWSFSDICGLVEMFDPGCGDGIRQTNGEAFTYLDVGIARGLVGAYATAFFDLHLRDATTAKAFLAENYPEGVSEVSVRP